MQLVAYGAQDIYLTGNPQITYFKVVYRRHTNFAMESIEQTFNGTVALGRRVTATISRNGDLIKDMWLEATFTNAGNANAVYGLGNALVKQAEIEIGGQLIDRQYGEWMNIWTELTVPEGKRVGYDVMVGNVSTANFFDGNDFIGTRNRPRETIDVPLQFWFNRNPGLALPLIALQYHEVKLNLELEGAGATGLGLGVDMTECKLFVDYLYLDTDERRRFAQVSHEYLIEQVQFTGDESINGTSKKLNLNLNHPVKALYFVSQSEAGVRGGTASQPCRFQALGFDNCKLQLNGHDRFVERREEYFLNVQTYKHHTHMPRANRQTCLSVTSARPEVLQVAPIFVTEAETALNNYNNAVEALALAGANATAGQIAAVPATALLLTTANNAAFPLNLANPQLTRSVLVEDNAQFIYMYSFSLNPEEHQPSGTCNFSRIDNAILQLSSMTAGLTGVIKVFAVNYNVLRIMSGMGGLAYSN